MGGIYAGEISLRIPTQLQPVTLLAHLYVMQGSALRLNLGVPKLCFRELCY